MIEGEGRQRSPLGSGLFSNFTTSKYFIIALNTLQQQKRFINLLKLLSVARLFVNWRDC